MAWKGRCGWWEQLGCLIFLFIICIGFSIYLITTLTQPDFLAELKGEEKDNTWAICVTLGLWVAFSLFTFTFVIFHKLKKQRREDAVNKNAALMENVRELAGVTKTSENAEMEENTQPLNP